MDELPPAQPSPDLWPEARDLAQQILADRSPAKNHTPQLRDWAANFLALPDSTITRNHFEVASGLTAHLNKIGKGAAVPRRQATERKNSPGPFGPVDRTLEWRPPKSPPRSRYQHRPHLSRKKARPVRPGLRRSRSRSHSPPRIRLRHPRQNPSPLRSNPDGRVARHQSPPMALAKPHPHPRFFFRRRRHQSIHLRLPPRRSRLCSKSTAAASKQSGASHRRSPRKPPQPPGNSRHRLESPGRSARHRAAPPDRR